MSRHILLRQLLAAAESMVQGGLSETTRRCGNPGCICHRDDRRRHGPHLYLTYRSEGKSRALYVPAEHAEQAYQGQAAWKEFGEIASAVAAENRERLRRQWTSAKDKAERRKNHD
jgi:hypothetical protein